MISSLQNETVKHLVKLRENKKYREEKKTVLISGIKLIKELSQQILPYKIFIESGYTPESTQALTYEVSFEVLKKITGLPSPEPIAAEFPLPSSTQLKDLSPILVLDAIRDPGNLGTLIRTAVALGWGGVFFLPTCVDPFNEKVIRASRGALFYLPWRVGSWEEIRTLKNERGWPAYIADTTGKDLVTLSKQKNMFLVLSNEAHGAAHESSLFGEPITIPMADKMESLNVASAGAILMYNLYQA